MVVPIFPPLLSSTQYPHSLQQSPLPKFMSMGHEYKFFGFSISYTIPFLKLLLYKYSCLHFPATIFPCPIHLHIPPSILSPFDFVHGPFIHVP